MNDLVSISAITLRRQRLIDDMEVRRFSRETQRNYIRDIGRFATLLRRSPDTATAEDIRRFQIEQLDTGVPVPTMNSIVSALRFFFIYTIDLPDLARRLIRAKHPRNLPAVLSRAGGGAGLSRPLYPPIPTGLPSLTAGCSRWMGWHHVPLQGVSPRRRRTPSDDDAGAGGIHPALTVACVAQGLPPYPPLRATRQRHAQGQHRAHPGVACRAPADGARYIIRRAWPGAMAPLSMLRGPNGHHRDLGRVHSTQSPAIGTNSSRERGIVIRHGLRPPNA